MSDDRFKEARRSLIDEEDDQASEDEPAEGEADEKTQMVDLDRLQKGAAQAQEGEGRSEDGGSSRRGQRGSNTERGGRREGREGNQPARGRGSRGSRERGDGDRRQGQQGRREGSQQGDRRGRGQGRRRGGSPEQSNAGRRGSSQGGRERDDGAGDAADEYDSTIKEGQRRGGGRGGAGGGRGADSDPSPSVSINAGSSQGSSGQEPSQPASSGSSGQQLSVPAAGDDSGGGGSSGQKLSVPGDQEADSREKTAFVNINDFADQEPEPSSSSQTFAPEQDQAGHEGSTQLVDINDLEGAPDQDDDVPEIAEDRILTTAYEFQPADIDRGEVTLVQATNQNGEQVLLRQVWSGDADEMPSRLRERIGAIDKLSIPGLITPEGMLITESGAWLEIQMPPGRRIGRILEREGPQEPERVARWVRSIAGTLGQVHDEGMVYANLTPASVWIAEGEDRERTFLEPFDVCSLADRGNLGQFGPPEMDVVDDTTQLSPAADVYSLAAVTLAGLTGIPLEPERVAAIDSETITSAVQKAVVDAPRERTQSVEEFAHQLGNLGSPSLLETLKVDPSELDFKTLLAITAGLMLATTGILFAVKGTPGSSPNRGGGGGGGGGQKAAAADQKNNEKGGGGESETSESSAPSESGDAEAPPETVEAPGPVESDPRTTVESSFQTNPPADVSRDIDGEAKELEDLRKKAREKLEQAENASGSAKETLTDALEAVARSIRLQDDEPTDADKELINDLYEKDPIREYYKSLITKIDDNLEGGTVSRSRLHYQKLRAIDPTATSAKFFTTINSAKVERVEPADRQSDSSEEDTDE